ncbi:molybdopterin-dependent oxidoreductase [Microlunatus spumicola]|uniref:Molybdopterin-dependent oxidoreductase n=1 Tax=Microlunatus spumicola TaxID=81499 RepID=A0ABP6XHG2_9ACTN
MLRPVPSRTQTRWAAVCGLVAGAAGIGISDLAAWLAAPAGSPLAAVGSVIIDLLPAGMVNFGKDYLGTADKPILLAIVALGVIALAAFGGIAELRRKGAGAAVFALVAVVGLVAVAIGSGSDVAAYVPTVVGLLLAFMLLSSLITRLRRWQPARAALRPDGPADPARRGFLVATSVFGVLAAAAVVGGRVLVGAANRVSAARSGIRLPTPATPAPAVPAGADLAIADLSPYLTPNEDFYRIDTALQVPVIDPAKWSVRVVGMVEQEVSLTFEELLGLPLVEHVATLTCVSNEVGGNLVGNATWLGYPIRELLARAKPLAGADMVLSRSEDGFTAGTPLDALTDPDRQSLLAVGMNGEPLPLEHGFPVRMVVPGLYGYVSATKWVVELKVTTFAEDEGYWTPLGWSARGPIKLASRIDVPGGEAPVGTVAVAGVAWAQHTGIGGVEVKIDGGDWNRAELAETTGPDTWRQWRYAWDAPAGDHELTVRATDADGTLQDPAEAAPAPNGASGYHSVRVTVR